MKNKLFYGLFFLLIGGGFLFRAVRLDLRPMHHDEANQAVKFGHLLESGEYIYDFEDHHGPTLYYLTLPAAWAASQVTLASLNEVTLRILPALFGTGLIILLLLTGLPPRPPLLWAGLCIALSPVMIFFSRFYIQETFLAFFILGFVLSLWRYRMHPRPGWAIAAGLFAGLMYTTKETAIIAFGAVFAAILLERWLGPPPETPSPHPPSHTKLHLLLGGGVFLLISILFFSSFFSHLQGPLDSIRAFSHYFMKAGSEGIHIHPWYYYIRMLAFSRFGPGPFWSEGLILVLAVFGSVKAIQTRRDGSKTARLLRLFLYYTLLSTVVYSLIPYKTPWNMLPFYIGFLILAGFGCTHILEIIESRPFKAAALILLVAGFYQLGIQSYRANFVYQADTRNPYVYAHTSSDFLNLVQRINDLSLLHPVKKKMLIRVIAGPYETWPLPWYLRKFERVGYWQDIEKVERLDDAAVIITSMDNTERLEAAILDNYQSEFYGLRPEVLLSIHIQKDLWEEFMRSRMEK